MTCECCGDDIEPGDAWVFQTGKGVFCKACFDMLKCKSCDGSGETRTTKDCVDTCPACKGSGKASKDA